MYDVIVIGAGVIGCSAAYALSKQGKKTLLIEQFPLPHTRGSSHGASRITRYAYPEPFHGEIMAVANPMWRTLEQETGMELLRETPLLCTTSTEDDVLSQYRRTIQKYSSGEVPLLDSKAISEKYPLMSYPPTQTGCVDSSAGILFADKCVQAFQRVFLSKGGVIADNHKVQEITPGDVVTVHTDRGDFQSKGVILSCGSWASQMLSKLGVFLPLQPLAIQVCYWKSKPGTDHSTLPTFIEIFKDGHIYGLPTNEYHDMVKICFDDGAPCDPDMRDQVDVDRETEHLATVKAYISRVFPNLIPEPAIKERCIYTRTPDETCVVDNHPKHKNIAYAAGFSGHGFKMAPVIGELLADLVQQRSSPKLLVDEMRSARFNKK